MGRIQEKILSQERSKITRKNKKASLREAYERTETMENRKKDSGQKWGKHKQNPLALFHL